MKVLITISTVLYQNKDNEYWIDGVYSNDFFNRYLQVFDAIKLVIRVKKVEVIDANKYKKLDCDRIEVSKLPFYNGPWQYAKKYFEIKKEFNEIIKDCDCGIFRIPDDVTFRLVKEMKKKHKPYLVENVSDSWDFFRPGTFKTILRPFLRIRWYILQKRACQNANCVSYVTSKYLQNRYKSNCNGIERFESYYTSADLYEFFYLKCKSKSDFFNDGIIKLVNVAGINSFSKGHKELIDLVLKLKENKYNVHLSFVGSGTMIDYFKNYSAKLNLNDNITFLGNVKDYKDIVSILSASDIFIFPSKTEGLPRAILEAMAAGLPCISCNVGGISELLDEECLYKFKDVNKLYSLVEHYINNLDILVEKSKRNFLVAKEYSYEKISNRRTDLYKKLKNLSLKE